VTLLQAENKPSGMEVNELQLEKHELKFVTLLQAENKSDGIEVKAEHPLKHP